MKNKLFGKDVTIGSWITLGDPAMAEIMATSGFDWLVVDMEHSALSHNQAQEIIRIINLCGITTLVRVMDHNPDSIKKYMDMGANGVIIPRVNSKSDAEKAVNAVKYPPIGTRGVGLFRAQNYSLDLNTYQKWNKDKSIVIVQIEHIEAINNIKSILSVEGVDGYIIGPYDLTASMGYPGEFEHPEVKKVLNKLKEIINNTKKPWGFHEVNSDPKSVIKRINDGYRFIAFGVDFLFFSTICKDKLSLVKQQIVQNTKCQ